MLSKTCLNFISDMEVTDHRHSMIDNIESKIENLQLQKCSLKNRSFWNLVISLETCRKQRDSTFRIMLYQRLNLS